MEGRGRIVFFSCLLSVAVAGMAQEVRVTCSPDKPEVLFGERVYATYEIENISENRVYVYGVEEGERVKVSRWKARAVGPKGEVPVREAPVHGAPEFKYLLKPGHKVIVHQPLPITDVTRPELAAGPYEIHFEMDYSLTPVAGMWEKMAGCTCRFWVKEANGEDAAWLKALEDDARRAQRSTLRRHDPSAPVSWYEVLEGTTTDQIPTLLSRFPTSTYAGYFLGLGEGFPVILDSKPEYVVKTLWRENYVANHPVASVSREVTREGKPCTVMAREPMGAYLQAQRARIESYLTVHPDHPRREVMELARAYQSLALGDRETALRSLEWVATRAPSERWKSQAQAVLGLLQGEK